MPEHASSHDSATLLPVIEANFLAFKGLQRLILDNEELTSERDQLLAERDQIVARLLELEAQATEVLELEARLHQSEQKVVTLGQEAVLLRVQFEEARSKWVEFHNVVLASSDRQAKSTERLNNLEATLNSKAEEVTTTEEKYAWLEERQKRVIEHNKVFTSTDPDLDVNLRAIISERDTLSTEVGRLKEELQRRAASLIVDKTYYMYSMRRKTLEEAKAGIIDFDAEIPKFSGTKEEPEGGDVEGQDGEVQHIELTVNLPTSHRGADVSLPPGSGDATT
ncbi:uncharacterized protein [Nicotiana sylvestris]|uniref:uncharacterized protein n=1 Tax=Nicotiana sylvestris TaxID=4096 RepID=UPI00388CB4B9